MTTKTASAKPRKTSVQAGAAKAVKSSRRVKPARQKSLFRRQPTAYPILPNVWRLAKTAASTLWLHRKLFVGITIVYGLLNLILVKGFSSGTDVSSLKNQLNQIFHGNFGPVTSGLGVFVVLLGSAGNGSSPTAGAYQVFLALLVSLAVIWALRQVMAGTLMRIRDAYYQGMQPLIPFMLVLLVIGLQLVPLLIGSGLYSTVISNGIALGVIEKLIWLLVFIVLALWSFYMLSASLFALYIVTLPDMTPIKAIRSARELVRRRRWMVMRKILALPVFLVIGAAIIMLPIIFWVTALAQWVFFVLTMFVLTAVHAYMYTLYRELLRE